MKRCRGIITALIIFFVQSASIGAIEEIGHSRVVLKEMNSSFQAEKKVALPGTELSNNESKPFYVLTIPKSGTFLLSKLMLMLTAKKGIPVWSIFKTINVWKFANEEPTSLFSNEEMQQSFDKRRNQNQFHIAHFNFAENFRRYSLDHTEYAKIILIRDLRDVCVSAAYFLSKEIEETINSSSMDDKLMFIIEGRDLSTSIGFFWKIQKLANAAIEWMKDPTVTICRFENLIGEKGGGSKEAQQKQIVAIANALNISLTSKKLDRMVNQLFGVTKGPDIFATFREGKVGSWQTHFKDEHKEAFNRVLGPYQKELGYPSF